MIGEVSLWRAVITQALQDAFSKAKCGQAKADAQNALHWLLNGGKDMQIVCDLADYSPEWVKKKISAVMENGYNWKAPAGNRKDNRKEYMKKRRLKKRHQSPNVL